MGKGCKCSNEAEGRLPVLSLCQSAAYQASLGIAWATAQGSFSILGLLATRSAEEIWGASFDDLTRWGISRRAAASFTELRRRFVLAEVQGAMQAVGARFVPIFGSEYPKELMHLRHPPAGLFVKGPKDVWERVLRSARITVVGTRKATSYGVQVTDSFVRTFVQAGVVVVSGMALGIDSVAHRAALAAGGLTLAILGSGIDVPYPRRNLALYSRIATEGAVISEFPPGMGPAQWTFPRRNRLLAALGDAVLVTEGSVSSGAMQTADWALELGRPVLSVPGSVMGESHSGCNRLLYEGAIVALQPNEALEDFFFVSRMERGARGPLSGWRTGTLEAEAQNEMRVEADPGADSCDALTGAQRRILDAVASRPCSVEALARQMGLSLRQVTALLGRLEIEGLVTRAGPGLYVHSDNCAKGLSKDESKNAKRLRGRGCFPEG